MTDFEKEVIDCILQYSPIAEADFGGLVGKTVYVPRAKIVFHLIPIPFAGWQQLPATCFQEQSLADASRNIQSVHLWLDCWINRPEIVRSRIAALLDACIRVHARRTKAHRITGDDVRRFFTENHLQGFVKARYHYGLYADGQLVAAASFGSGRTVSRNGVTGRSFELLRYASRLHHRVVGGLGKLIARFAEEQKPDDIMTYADLDWASGKGYRALNFVQTAVTPPQAFWIHPADMVRYYPHRLPLQLADAFKRQDKYANIDDFLIDKGYISIHNAGNLKYILPLGG